MISVGHINGWCVFIIIASLLGCSTIPRFSPPSEAPSVTLVRLSIQPSPSGTICITNNFTHKIQCYTLITNTTPTFTGTNIVPLLFQYPSHNCNWFIQSSSDFKNWITLYSFFSGGAGYFRGVDVTTNQHNFYRELVNWK